MPEPAYRSVPARGGTNGDLAIQVGRDLGLPPDDDQQDILNAIFATAPDDPTVPASYEVAVVAPRQNIKTSTLEIAALTDLFVFREPLHVWTAHLFDTSQKTFKHMSSLIENAPDYRDLCRWPPRTANGDESIELLTGESIEFYARSKRGGRGITARKITLDEALFLDDGDMGALMPTTATIPDAQVRYGSSAGLAESSVLRGLRDRGRPGTGDLAYFEWCAPHRECGSATCDHKVSRPDCALDDRELWRLANPALGRRISEKRLQQFRESMPPLEFAREFLTWWDEPAIGEIAIPGSRWTALADPHSQIVGRLAFSIDMAPDRGSAAIAVSGKNAAGLSHVEVVDYRDGVDWVVARAVEVCKNAGVRTICLDAAGPVASLVPDLEGAGLEVEKLTVRDVVAACGGLYDDAMSSPARLVHIGQPALDVAIAGGVKQPSGDAWKWSRKNPSSDICPLVAVTLARYFFATQPQKPVFAY